MIEACMKMWIPAVRMSLDPSVNGFWDCSASAISTRLYDSFTTISKRLEMQGQVKGQGRRGDPLMARKASAAPYTSPSTPRQRHSLGRAPGQLYHTGAPPAKEKPYLGPHWSHGYAIFILTLTPNCTTSNQTQEQGPENQPDGNLPERSTGGGTGIFLKGQW